MCDEVDVQFIEKFRSKQVFLKIKFQRTKLFYQKCETNETTEKV